MTYEGDYSYGQEAYAHAKNQDLRNFFLSSKDIANLPRIWAWLVKPIKKDYKLGENF